MKSLKFLNVSVFLILALLFSACGSDSDETIAVNNNSTSSKDPAPGNNGSMNSSITVSSWSDFYSKVESGGFVSLDTFKTNYGIANYSTIVFKFQKCSVDKTWIFNMTSCTSSFERYFMGSTLMREDNLHSRDEVHSSLKSIIASATSYYYYGGAKYGFYSNNVFYQFDLNYPLEVNPIAKQESSSDDDREIYTQKGFTYY